MAKALMRSRRSSTLAESSPHVGKLKALFARALRAHRAGRISQAISLYKRLLVLEPSLSEPHNNLGVALASLGKLDEAAAQYRRALELDPNYGQASINLGYLLRDIGRFVPSEAAFRHAITINPNNGAAYSGLGTALIELSRPAEAEAALRRAIALEPDFSGAYNNLGLLLKEAGRLDEAEQLFEQAIRLAPKNTAYYENLAAIKSVAPGQSHLATLETLARDAASLSAEDRMHLRFALAKAYEDMARPERAFEELLAANALKRQQVGYDERTTLARMDRTREVFNAELLSSHRGCGEPSPVPVFIVGMPRSGSSVIEQILASHPAVFGAGELSLFEQSYRAICEKLPGSTLFPDAVATLKTEQFGMLGTHYLGELMRRAAKASRITDKMPDNFLLTGLIHLALPNATIIHTVRDPIDTCVSCFANHFTRGQIHTYDLAELGRYYRHYRALMDHWHRVLPAGRIMDVHYEELVDDLEGVARRIVSHCGLAWDARCLEFHRTARVVRTASAVQVRRPIYRTSVGRWHRCEAFLGPLLATLDPSIGAASSVRRLAGASDGPSPSNPISGHAA